MYAKKIFVASSHVTHHVKRMRVKININMFFIRVNIGQKHFSFIMIIFSFCRQYLFMYHVADKNTRQYCHVE